MIYQINDNYYIKVGAKYVKLKMDVDKRGELKITPTKEKLENTGNLKIRELVLQDSKNEIIRKLRKYSNEDDKFLR